jgi:MFS family permease
MLPLTGGFLVAGPISGYLSDRYGARAFATGGMLLAALSFGLLELLPIQFPYVWFALLLLLNGLAMGLLPGHLAPGKAAYLTGHSFFPNLISGPFGKGLHEAFDFAIGAVLLAAAASWLRGAKPEYAKPVKAAIPTLVVTDKELEDARV